MSSTYRCSVVLSLLLLACPALAQSRDAATLAAAGRDGDEGMTLYEQRDYVGAVDKFERAYAAVKIPTFGLWSGRALEKAGKLVEASQRYREVTLTVVRPSDPSVFRSARADAQKAYDGLAARIPQLTVELEGASASEVSVTIDGNAVPSALIGAAVPVNPGTCKVEGRRGQQLVTEAVPLREGERRTLTLLFVAVPTPTEVATKLEDQETDKKVIVIEPSKQKTIGTPPPPPVTKRWWFWTGLGAVVLGGTAVALAVALGGHGGQQPLYQGSAGSLRGP